MDATADRPFTGAEFWHVAARFGFVEVTNVVAADRAAGLDRSAVVMTRCPGHDDSRLKPRSVRRRVPRLSRRTVAAATA
jgi:hypothetical protein